MSLFRLGSCLGLLAAAVILLAGVGLAAVEISGEITSDTVLGLTSPAPDGIYIVVADLTVTNGATLTVEAGVQLRFEPAVSLWVGGAAGEAGVLRCLGTDQSPVLLTSNSASPQPGDWSTLYFRSGADGSQLQSTVVEYGGGATAGVYVDGADITVTGCKLRHLDGAGLLIGGDSAAEVLRTTVDDAGGFGITLRNTSSPSIHLALPDIRCTVSCRSP